MPGEFHPVHAATRATRVIARTFEYDTRPVANAAASSGSSSSRRATRTCSRAALGDRPIRQDSQWAHDSMPGPAQPSRRSNSAIQSSSSASAAAMRPARRQMPSASAVADTARVMLTRRVAALLVLAGAWPLLIWPNFIRVVATDDRAFADGPTAYLLVHVALAVVSMALGLALVVVGVRGWRRAR